MAGAGANVRSGQQANPPVARPALHVCHCNNLNATLAFAKDNRIWVPAQQSPPGTGIKDWKLPGILGYSFEYSVKFFKKPCCGEPTALAVPLSCCGCLVESIRMDFNVNASRPDAPE
jgi:hypothetical protein